MTPGITAELFVSFLQIGVCSIGGGYATIPLIRRQAVAVHGWISMQEFGDIITISQMTPGPLAVNTSTFTGLRIGGAAGAVSATLGCILPGILLALLLYTFFSRFRSSPAAAGTLFALRAASTGLIASAAATIITLVFQLPAIAESAETAVQLSDLKDVLQALPALSPQTLTASLLLPGAVLAASFWLLRKYRVNPMYIMLGSAAAGIAALLF